MVDKMSYCLYFPATTARFVKKTVPIRMFFKPTLSQKSFYVFRKDRQCKFIFLLSPSLDLINIISVWALETMKVAGETLLAYYAGCWLLSTTLNERDLGTVSYII